MKTSQSLFVSKDGSKFEAYPSFKPKITPPKHFSRECSTHAKGQVLFFFQKDISKLTDFLRGHCLLGISEVRKKKQTQRQKNEFTMTSGGFVIAVRNNFH